MVFFPRGRIFKGEEPVEILAEGFLRCRKNSFLLLLSLREED